MRPFDSDFGSFWGAPNRLFRRPIHTLGSGTKKPSMIYMVPTNPSKPSFLMKPNNYRSSASSNGCGMLTNDFGHNLGPNYLSSPSLIGPYPGNKFERFPQIPTSQPIEPPVKPWYINDDSYLDENARHARKLLNEIDIKTKMKKYDANELFNTEILDQLEVKQNDQYPGPSNTTATCDPVTRNIERRQPATSLGLHRSNSSLPNRYSSGCFQSQAKRLNNFYFDEPNSGLAANYSNHQHANFRNHPHPNLHHPNPNPNPHHHHHNNYSIDNSTYLDDFRSYI